MSGKVNPNISVDCVVFGFDGASLNVLLIESESEQGDSVKTKIPGDLIELGEGLDDAASRVLYEVTGLKEVHLKQFHSFGEPDRTKKPGDRSWLEHYRTEPDARVITIAYYALVKMEDFELSALSEGQRPFWQNIGNVPDLIFDHNEIVEVGLWKLQRHFLLNKSAYELLPEKFTLNQLQQLHEAIMQEDLDKRNFRKKAVRENHIEATEEKQEGVLHKPARLYRIKR